MTRQIILNFYMIDLATEEPFMMLHVNNNFFFSVFLYCFINNEKIS